MDIDPQEFAVLKLEISKISDVVSRTYPEKFASIESALENDRIDIRLLAKEVQDLTGAVRESNKILVGSNGNSILVRLALIEAGHSDLKARFKVSNEDTASDDRARLQLVGTTITSILALIGTVLLGIFSLWGS